MFLGYMINRLPRENWSPSRFSCSTSEPTDQTTIEQEGRLALKIGPPLISASPVSHAMYQRQRFSHTRFIGNTRRSVWSAILDSPSEDTRKPFLNPRPFAWMFSRGLTRCSVISSVWMFEDLVVSFRRGSDGKKRQVFSSDSTSNDSKLHY